MELRDKHINFTIDDFEHYFGLEFKGNIVCVSNAPNFVKKFFVNSISKYVYRSCLNMSNF